MPEKLCRLFDGVCMCVEWTLNIFFRYDPYMTHMDGLCDPYNIRYIPGIVVLMQANGYQATFSTPTWPAYEVRL